LERKKLFEETQYFYKSTLLEKHYMRQILKKQLGEQLVQKEKTNYYQKAWIKLITIILLCQTMKLKKEVKIIKNFK